MKPYPRVTIAGAELSCLDVMEAQFLQQDVGAYFAHGITLAPGDVVIDAGANIGVFAAEVSRRTGGDVEVLSFEPIPSIHAVLADNAAHHIKGRIHAVNLGVGAREATVEFSYFPRMTLFSSAHRGRANVDAEVKRMAASMIALIKTGRAKPQLRWLPKPLLEGYVETWLRGRMTIETTQCRIRPLSAVLDERGFGGARLLKIDVEGAELDALDGVADAHWPLIAQVVVEVEGYRGRASQVVERLVARGYRVEAAQDEAQQAGDTGLVYARRA